MSKVPRSAYVRRFLHNRGWHRFCRIGYETKPNPFYNAKLKTKDGIMLDLTTFGEGPTRTVTYHR